MPRSDSIRRQVQHLLEELGRIESLPEDDFEDGDVIQFKRRFPGSPMGGTRDYTYVAVKINGGWWLSGKNEGFTTWDRLRSLFASGQVVELWVATAWEQVELPT